jgi:hypothetical protein
VNAICSILLKPLVVTILAHQQGHNKSLKWERPQPELLDGGTREQGRSPLLRSEITCGLKHSTSTRLRIDGGLLYLLSTGLFGSEVRSIIFWQEIGWMNRRSHELDDSRRSRTTGQVHEVTRWNVRSRIHSRRLANHCGLSFMCQWTSSRSCYPVCLLLAIIHRLTRFWCV